ncbi:MAG: tetratricopeptide repeat protein [Parafilimonas sp.]|nr:tetratricopeptide repeat protein [Parafilimonas sp.]
MDNTIAQLQQQAEDLLSAKNYAGVIAVLPDDLLQQYNDAGLYSLRARAYEALRDTDATIQYATKAIEINPSLIVAYISRGNAWTYKREYDKAIEDYTNAITLDENNSLAFYNRGLALYYKRDYDKAMDDYNKAIALKPDETGSYIGRGNVWLDKAEYDKAIDDYNKVLSLDANNADAYYNRGLAWSGKKESEKAIRDFNEAIVLNKNYADTYLARGNVWFDKGEYDKAMADYNTAINLDNNYDIAYFNRGLVWANKKEYEKAIDDYNKTLTLNPVYLNAYYNRALAFNAIQEYEKAVEDYKKYIELINNPDNYWSQVAQSAIQELEKKLTDEWYKETAKLVNKIKNLLLFKERCVTHYTGLSAAKAMILVKSKFRLSEGAFLNDTSEGREMFKYLEFSAVKQKDDKTLAEPFSEKPFIGSFVTEAKHDDLTLWRMYAKEDKIEARGCALTIDKEYFLSSLKNAINNATVSAANAIQTEEQFTFYKVAYITNDTEPVFLVPGDDVKGKDLTKMMRELKEIMKEIPEDQSQNAKELLNGIAYLFKSVEYQYENEVRLIVQGVGFDKTISSDSIPPRVFIELVGITDALTKITLGPKVERADEWAAAFNYQIKKDISSASIDIIISHLPFK